MLTPEKAKIIGYLQTDGCLRHTKKTSGGFRYEISFANKDNPLLCDFIRLVGIVYPSARACFENVGRGCKKVVFNSKLMYEDLITFGKFSTATWRINRNTINEKVAKKYIQGIFYGDGSVTKDGRNIFIECQSEEGLKKVRNILKIFDIKSVLRKRTKRKEYVLSINRVVDRWLFYQYIGLPLQPRKHLRIQKGLEETGRMSGWRTLNIGNEQLKKWLNFFFTKNGVFDFRKGRVYLKNKNKGELKSKQNLLKKYGLSKTTIIGPTNDNSFILMVQNIRDMKCLQNVLSEIPKNRKRRLKDVIKRRGEINA